MIGNIGPFVTELFLIPLLIILSYSKLSLFFHISISIAHLIFGHDLSMRFYMGLDKGKPKCWVDQEYDEAVPEPCSWGLSMDHREDGAT